MLIYDYGLILINNNRPVMYVHPIATGHWGARPARVQWTPSQPPGWFSVLWPGTPHHMISVVQHHQSIFSASFSRRCYANLKQWMLSQIMICSSWMKTMLSQLNICLMILIMTSELCASCCSSGWQESTWSSRTRSAMSGHIAAGSDCQAHEVVKYLFVTMNMCFSLMKIMLSQVNIFSWVWWF